MFPCSPLDMRSRCRSWKYKKILDLTVQEHSGCFLSLTFFGLNIYRVAAQGFCLHWNWEFSSVCWFAVHIYPSSSTVNKEKILPDQRASLQVDTRETQQPDVAVLVVTTYSLAFPCHFLVANTAEVAGSRARLTCFFFFFFFLNHIYRLQSVPLPKIRNLTICAVAKRSLSPVWWP